LCRLSRKFPQATLASVKEVLLDAVAAHPSFDVLVTGHSLGGGAAALLALLLRREGGGLPPRSRRRVRAVCLAPAAVLSRNLSWGAAPYVASIVYRELLIDLIDAAVLERVLCLGGEGRSVHPCALWEKG
jgi:pimeloyl-ACP methyl ester carboxylesterase